MQDLAYARFYLHLYWGQLRLHKQSYDKKITRVLMVFALISSFLILAQIKAAFDQPALLHTSLLFQASLVLGVLLWLMLFTHLLWPAALTSLVDELTLWKTNDKLCREIAMNNPPEDYQDLLKDPKLRFKKDRLGKTPLFYLCRTNQIALVQNYIHDKPELINQEDDLGETPFIEALRSSHSELIAYLWELKPQLKNGFTPLMVHAAISPVQELKNAFLRSSNEKKTAFDGTTSLLIAARAKQFENLDILLEKIGSCQADQFGDHPLDWIIQAQDQNTFLKLLDSCDPNKEHLIYLDDSNNSFLHKAVIFDWPFATQELHHRDDILVTIKNTSQQTALGLAAPNSPHQQILTTATSNTANPAPTVTVTTTSSRNRSVVSQALVDFDMLAVHLEKALEGTPESSSLVKKLTRDLEDFYKGSSTKIQLWAGTHNTNMDAVAKLIGDIFTSKYAGIFAHFSYVGHREAQDPSQFTNAFLDKNKFPDNAVIFITDADSLLDEKGMLIAPAAHAKMLKELNTVKNNRKLFFVYVGVFSKRAGPPLREADRKEIFGDALHSIPTYRYFNPPQVEDFSKLVIPAYKAQDVKLSDDALIELCNYCVKQNLTVEAFLSLIKEVPNFFDGNSHKEYSLENITAFLEAR